MTDAVLPSEFSDLVPLVSEWALDSDRARAVKRIYTDIDVLRNFHAEMRPRIEAVIEFLNRRENDPDKLPREVKNLYQLALTFMEISAPIDLEWNSGDIEDTFPMDRFEFLPFPAREQTVS